MNQYGKKLIAFIASIFMVVSLLPGVTFAQEDNTAYSSSQNTEGDYLSDTNSALREGQNAEESNLGDSQISDAKDLEATDNMDISDETRATSDGSTNENQEEDTATTKMTYSVAYSMHVQTYGWLEEVTDGTTVGEAGSGKRSEAIMIRILTDKAVGAEDVTEGKGDNTEETEASVSEDTLGVRYRAHVQGIGWQDWVSDGSMAGTTGEAKRMEALEIELTGTPASDYNVYYRVYVNTYGWMSWAQDGETAGSVSYGKAIESLEIRLCKKDAETSPETEGRSCLTKAMIGSINYSAHVQTIGWQEAVQAGETAGTTGKTKRMEALIINRDSDKSEGDDLFSGGISYRAHVQSIGWEDWVNDGAVAGTTGQAKRMEAIEINLTGELATYADVYYRTHIQGYGWLGWAKNGQTAGSTGIKYRMEAIQIKVVPKDREAPGSNSGYYKDKPLPPPQPVLSKEMQMAENRLNAIGRNLRAAFNWSVMPYVKYSTGPSYGSAYYARYGFTNHKGNCYVMAATFYYMAKRLGYDAHQVSGYVASRNGGQAIHSWVEIVINGTTYVFDPDFTKETGRNGYMIRYGTSGTWRYNNYRRMN